MLKFHFIAICFVLLGYTIPTAAQSWKTYPYNEPGSVINFPVDEGWHPNEALEWWYTTAHVTGQTSGTNYSFMLTYFYEPTFPFDGIRIFNIANESTGGFYTDMQPCTYILAQDRLDIAATVGVIPLTHQEEWVTLTDTVGNLIPFEYHIAAESQYGNIDVTYNTLKRPLMVGDDGFVYLAATDSSYYYSQTKVDVQGTLTLNSFTEQITGTAWIDRQYGEMTPLGGIVWEWFSYQLSNGMDLNVWNLFTDQNEIPDTPTYRFCSVYVNDSTSYTTSGFSLTRLKYAWMPDNQRCYAQQWRFIDTNIDLTITTLFEDQEVFLPFRFYEGSTSIQGTVNGLPVTGVGFAELLHSYENPNILVKSPDGIGVWDGTQPVTWQLLNPDDGRPVTYDLELTTDGGLNYTSIALGLTDTMYNWNGTGIDSTTPCQLKVTGYSVDSTLVGSSQSVVFFVLTGIGDNLSASGKDIMTYAFPNPFSLKTTIVFELRKPEDISIGIYNLTGQLIMPLLDEYRNAGLHQVVWDGKDKHGAKVSPGVYLYKLETEDYEVVTRSLLLE